MSKKILPKELRIVKHENPEIIESKYSFSYESYDEPKLVELRRRYKLDEVVRDAKSEFEKFVLLRDWVKSRWAHGWDESKATDTLDGLALLKDAERGLEFCCGSYVLLFVQCVCSAWGIGQDGSASPKRRATSSHLMREMSGTRSQRSGRTSSESGS